MILVTGGTGTTGKYILEELSARGARVRALVRNPAKAPRLPGVEIVTGDLAQPETLPAALHGIQSALLLTSPTPDSVAIQSNFLQAAKKARLPHLVKFSALGAAADSPVRFLRWHGETEKEIEESGIPFTFLQPNGFMQNTLAFAGTLQSQGAFYAPLANAAVSFVDVRDIAGIAAATLVERTHDGQHYVITGPAAITYAEAADTFSHVLGKPVKYVAVSDDAARQAMSQSGMPDWLVSGLIELHDLYKHGGASLVTGVVKQIGRKEPASFEQFVRDHAAAFGG